MKGYPISLVGLDTARCVVIGGGDVAARKVAGLRAAGAWVVVISPVLCEPLEGRVARGDIEALQRPYRSGDLAGA
ncbi:MAG: siroheme synthase, partial [Anaerolineae bacterium]|nr:siroheme synthase [Anaerolineae bacterium]